MEQVGDGELAGLVSAGAAVGRHLDGHPTNKGVLGAEEPTMERRDVGKVRASWSVGRRLH